jgi:hypothetical protein
MSSNQEASCRETHGLRAQLGITSRSAQYVLDEPAPREGVCAERGVFLFKPASGSNPGTTRIAT